MLYAGSLTFTPPQRPVDLRDWRQWWSFMKGADWRHPYGPRTNVKVLDNHPVVHVSYSDALAYARWTGKELPTEAEWELAARGGLVEAEFAWGEEFSTDISSGDQPSLNAMRVLGGRLTKRSASWPRKLRKQRKLSRAVNRCKLGRVLSRCEQCSNQKPFAGRGHIESKRLGGSGLLQAVAASTQIPPVLLERFWL